MDDAPNQRIINPVVFVRELITKADDSGCLLDASEPAAIDPRQIVKRSSNSSSARLLFSSLSLRSRRFGSVGSHSATTASTSSWRREGPWP